ncbi:hypothetical protein [Treponema pedis]|nr:hypothetical protein [Treponema pedis]
MKTKLCIYSQANYLFRIGIVMEQKRSSEKHCADTCIFLYFMQ